MSPGLTPRPSLSVRTYVEPPPGTGHTRVAGVDAPAFVERRQPRVRGLSFRFVVPVSPGFDAPAFVERTTWVNEAVGD